MKLDEMLTEQQVVENMTVEQARQSLSYLRAAARRQADGTQTFAHSPTYRHAFVRGILLRRKKIRNDSHT